MTTAINYLGPIYSRPNPLVPAESIEVQQQRCRDAGGDVRPAGDSWHCASSDEIVRDRVTQDFRLLALEPLLDRVRDYIARHPAADAQQLAVIEGFRRELDALTADVALRDLAQNEFGAVVTPFVSSVRQVRPGSAPSDRWRALQSVAWRLGIATRELGRWLAQEQGNVETLLQMSPQQVATHYATSLPRPDWDDIRVWLASPPATFIDGAEKWRAQPDADGWQDLAVPFPVDAAAIADATHTLGNAWERYLSTLDLIDQALDRQSEITRAAGGRAVHGDIRKKIAPYRNIGDTIPIPGGGAIRVRRLATGPTIGKIGLVIAAAAIIALIRRARRAS